MRVNALPAVISLRLVITAITTPLVAKVRGSERDFTGHGFLRAPDGTFTTLMSPVLAIPTPATSILRE
jgi:hypothetical protein